jgi:hypothetical protein
MIPRGQLNGSFTLSWDGRVLEKTITKGDASGAILIKWNPCVVGGPHAPTITGLDPAFLPRGVHLVLEKFKREKAGCSALYRIIPRKTP